MRTKIAGFLHHQEKQMFQLLQALVLQCSPSRYKKGVDAVGGLLRNALHGYDLKLEVSRQPEFGDHLLFRSPAWDGNRPGILLFGHMDTVFPLDSPFNWYTDDGQRVCGPGVIDMKGGLVCALYAIKALAACGLLDTIPLTLLCNSDEEIGSPTSSALFAAEAGNSLMALGFECGGLRGEVATGRKGRSGYRLTVSGKAGHAAFAGADKASAILELAHKIVAIEGMNDQERQIVVNVGTVHGGIGANTVAETAVADIDTRFLTLADAAETAGRLARIADMNTIAGTRAQIAITGERLPMEQTVDNTRLFHLIACESRRLTIPCIAELRSGVSDANTIAQARIPVVDGMGPCGDCDHSDREYMLRQSLPARALLAACSILAGWEHFQSPSPHPSARS